jgi:hypothetical protein
MEPEAEKAAAPAAAAEASNDAIQEESSASAPTAARDEMPGSGTSAAAPEVEVQLFRQGRGPVVVFRSQLGGYTQDQLEVGDILEQYGLKSVFAFDPAARTRGVAIRFHPRNGRSLLTYAPGCTIFVDGDPKVFSEVVPQTPPCVNFPLVLLATCSNSCLAYLVVYKRRN